MRAGNGQVQGSEATLVAALLAQAASRGAKVALRHKRLGVWQALTWRELRDQVSALASALAERGFAEDGVLVVVSRPRPEALLFSLAAQWLGGVAALLDPEAGAETVVRQLRGLNPRHLFVEGLDEILRAQEAGVIDAATHVFHADGRGLEAHAVLGSVAYVDLVAGSDPALPPLKAQAWQAAFSFHREAPDGSPEVQWLTHAELRWHGEALVSSERLGAEEEAFAARTFAAGGQARYLLAPWLIAGFRLNFPESLATRDNDRRELGPTLVAGTRETYQRLEGLVRELLPARGWRRKLVDWGFDPQVRGVRRWLAHWLVIRPLRDVIGFSRTRAPLIVGVPLPASSQRFFTSLGVHVRAWPEASTWRAQQDVQAARPERSALTVLRQAQIVPREAGA